MIRTPYFAFVDRYATGRIVDARAATLQGPSLLLASSRPLSESDLAKFYRVGNSDKREDFSTTGRFGIGLQCMYGFADTWSLLANDTLLVFDPLHIAVTNPGQPNQPSLKCGK